MIEAIEKYRATQQGSSAKIMWPIRTSSSPPQNHVSICNERAGAIRYKVIKPRVEIFSETMH